MATLKSSSREDLPIIARCYLEAFPDSFTTKLGIKYVMKTLEWYLVNKNCFLFHLESDQECHGFCGGVVRDGSQKVGSSSGIFEYSLNVGLTSLVKKPWLLFHKVILQKFSFIWDNIQRIFLRRKRVGESKAEVEGRVEAGLVVIGVDPAHQGRGYGSSLLQEFEKRCRELHVGRMRLSVKLDNTQAIRSYQKNGWTDDIVKADTISMIKNLD